MEQKEIYILKEDFVDDFNGFSSIRAFTSLDKAKEEMNFIIEEYEENNTKNRIVERDERTYSCYEDGEYNNYHFNISIEKVYLE